MFPINPSKISKSALKLSLARLQALNKHFCVPNNPLSNRKENAKEEFYLKLTEKSKNNTKLEVSQTVLSLSDIGSGV